MQNRTLWTIVILLVVLGLLACCCIGLVMAAGMATYRTTTGVTEFRTVPGIPILPGVTTVRGTRQVVEREFPLGDVDRVHLTTSADLTIRLGTEASIHIEAEENIIDLVEWEEHNRSLIISMRPNIRIIRHEPILITLTVPNLVAVVSAGSGNIDAPDMLGKIVTIHLMGSGDINVDYIEAQTVDIASRGSGDIRVLGVEADRIDVNMMGSGSVHPGDGVVNTQEITITGSGDYMAENLESAQVTASLMGSGSARVRVIEELSARLFGSGDLEYIGSPTMDASAVGSGRIRQVER